MADTDRKALILAPIAIVDAMFTACAVSEPDTGETPWNAATNYSIGQKAIRSTTHRVYTALANGVDAGLPEATPLRWDDTGPTNKWAAFDIYRSTALTYTGTLTLTIKPGIITDAAFYGLVGDTLRFNAKDAGTGISYFDTTYSLASYLTGDLEWNFWFGNPQQQDGLRVKDLIPHDAQIEITITPSIVTGTSAIGIMAVGSFAKIGEAQHGFTAKLVDYSIRSIDKNGNLTVKKGLTATDLSGQCLLDSETEAQQTFDVMKTMLGTPCAVVISDVTGYDYLNVFGLVSAEIDATDTDHATMKLDVAGTI